MITACVYVIKQNMRSYEWVENQKSNEGLEYMGCEGGEEDEGDEGDEGEKYRRNKESRQEIQNKGDSKDS